MKDRNFNNNPDGPQLDENDPVWRLLAESPRPEPDAWFAVRTVARCRNAELGGDWFAFRGILRWALGGGLGVCLAILLLVPHTHPEVPAPDQKKNVQEAFEIMASMNAPADSQSSSTSTWQDSSL
jgi:hypothetical protein